MRKSIARERPRNFAGPLPAELLLSATVTTLAEAPYAQVAELADALGSGPSGINFPWRFESSSGH